MSRQLLVPMDDSEPARAALHHALSLFPDAEITVIHAVDDLAAGYSGRPPAAAGEEAEPEFFDDVDRLAEEYGVAIDRRVVSGTAAEAVLEFADEAEIDQIIMGSRGRSGVSRVLLGSIAEQVARRATVPVTIVR
ncbi:universal stress protein [Natrononativus amylolyticus]|uniref:universal stress protein n=1 Tax=Natrononativus amylolyticus TaxID=2963434 RepID=UPI0020CF7B0D|nr:universal stress protein [Natrononativus amylolyticus]